MYRNQAMQKQGGSMLIISLFVIIVLALLGVTMTRMLSAASQSTIIEIYGVRALTAAQSGVQNLLQQSFPLNAQPSVCNTTITSPPAFSNIDGLKGCRYSATCTTETVIFAGQSSQYYRYLSEGECSIGDIVVNRQVAIDAIQETP